MDKPTIKMERTYSEIERAVNLSDNKEAKELCSIFDEVIDSLECIDEYATMEEKLKEIEYIKRILNLPNNW